LASIKSGVAAVQNFGPANDRSGSFASDQSRQPRRPMSAPPQKADKQADISLSPLSAMSRHPE
jgi:hypothetical protein